MFSPIKFVVQVFVGFSGSIVIIGICELIYNFWESEREGAFVF